MNTQITDYLAMQANKITEKSENIKTFYNKIEDIGTVPCIIAEINKTNKIMKNLNINHMKNIENDKNIDNINTSKKHYRGNRSKKFLFPSKKNNNNSNKKVNCIKHRLQDTKILLDVFKSTLINKCSDEPQKDLEVNFYNLILYLTELFDNW